jgi:hypothetical protein
MSCYSYLKLREVFPDLHLHHLMVPDVATQYVALHSKVFVAFISLSKKILG